MKNLLLFCVLITGCRCGSTPVTPAPGDALPPPDAVVLPGDAPQDAPDAPPLPNDASGHGDGSFAVGITVGATTTNCARAGADITQFDVHLENGAGTCVPVTFRLVGGAADGGLARSTCPGSPVVTPAVFSCFEPDTLVTATVPSGGYHLVVDAWVGDRVCWRGDASLGVGETPDEQTLTLLHQDACQ